MNIAVILLMGAAGAVALLWRARLLRRRTTARLDEAIPSLVAIDQPRADKVALLVSQYPRRYPWLPPVFGLIVAVALRVLVPLPLEVSLAFGTLGAVLAYLLEEAIAAARTTLIETQLSEAIDLLVASLRAGSALVAAFEYTLQDARPPLRPYLQEIVGRVRLGDDPREVIMALADEVPLETFRLFSMSLAIHWEVGGSLASTLATVGRTIRDRIELDRRVRAQGVEAHASVAAVLGITYILAYLMWQSSPERMLAFVGSGLGTHLVALVIGLQAVGLIWMSRVSRSGF
jgi:tight adherence protein B